MIADRLTAKFQSPKTAKRRGAKSKARPQRSAKGKVAAPAADHYTRGRTLSGAFWL